MVDAGASKEEAVDIPPPASGDAPTIILYECAHDTVGTLEDWVRGVPLVDKLIDTCDTTWAYAGKHCVPCY